MHETIHRLPLTSKKFVNQAFSRTDYRIAEKSVRGRLTQYATMLPCGYVIIVLAVLTNRNGRTACTGAAIEASCRHQANPKAVAACSPQVSPAEAVGSVKSIAHDLLLLILS